MKKENIYVVIDSEEKRLRALQILEDAGEIVYSKSIMLDEYDGEQLGTIHLNRCFDSGNWQNSGHINKTQITLDQLEQLLNPNYAVKEVHLTIDELKAQVDALGFELVKKERKPKVGDFGVFWPGLDSYKYVGFLTKICVGFYDHDNARFDNFRFLTDEEKEEIQNNW